MLSREEILEILKYIMNDGRLYGVITALRGADTTHRELLEMYTTTIRRILEQKENPVKIILRNIIPYCVKEVIYNLDSIEGNLVHFLIHVDNAFATLLNLELIPLDVYSYVRGTINIIQELRKKLVDEGFRMDIDMKLVYKYIDEIEESYRSLWEKYMKSER